MKMLDAASIQLDQSVQGKRDELNETCDAFLTEFAAHKLPPDLPNVHEKLAYFATMSTQSRRVTILVSTSTTPAAKAQKAATVRHNLTGQTHRTYLVDLLSYMERDTDGVSLLLGRREDVSRLWKECNDDVSVLSALFDYGQKLLQHIRSHEWTRAEITTLFASPCHADKLERREPFLSEAFVLCSLQQWRDALLLRHVAQQQQQTSSVGVPFKPLFPEKGCILCELADFCNLVRYVTHRGGEQNQGFTWAWVSLTAVQWMEESANRLWKRKVGCVEDETRYAQFRSNLAEDTKTIHAVASMLQEYNRSFTLALSEMISLCCAVKAVHARTAFTTDTTATTDSATPTVLIADYQRLRVDMLASLAVLHERLDQVSTAKIEADALSTKFYTLLQLTSALETSVTASEAAVPVTLQPQKPHIKMMVLVTDPLIRTALQVFLKQHHVHCLSVREGKSMGQQVDAFQEGCQTLSVLLCTFEEAAEGVDIPKLTDVVLFNGVENDEVAEQGICRGRRVGATHGVNVWRFQLMDSIDDSRSYGRLPLELLTVTPPSHASQLLALETAAGLPVARNTVQPDISLSSSRTPAAAGRPPMRQRLRQKELVRREKQAEISAFPNTTTTTRPATNAPTEEEEEEEKEEKQAAHEDEDKDTENRDTKAPPSRVIAFSDLNPDEMQAVMSYMERTRTRDAALFSPATLRDILIGSGVSMELDLRMQQQQRSSSSSAAELSNSVLRSRLDAYIAQQRCVPRTEMTDETDHDCLYYALWDQSQLHPTNITTLPQSAAPVSTELPSMASVDWAQRRRTSLDQECNLQEFRAVAVQQMREQVATALETDAKWKPFRAFTTDTPNAIRHHAWGDNLALMIVADVMGRNIHILHARGGKEFKIISPRDALQRSQANCNPPLYIACIDDCHFLSLWKEQP